MQTTDHRQDLFRLVYASRGVASIVARFDATVTEIVAVSQRNNALVGVTGLLLAHQGWFVQALEGPRRHVGATFGRIGRDPRHGMLEVFEAAPADQRLFAKWGMCARRLTPESGPVLDELELNRDFDPFRMTAGQTLGVLRAIAQAETRRGGGRKVA